MSEILDFVRDDSDITDYHGWARQVRKHWTPGWNEPQEVTPVLDILANPAEAVQTIRPIIDDWFNGKGDYDRLHKRLETVLSAWTNIKWKMMKYDGFHVWIELPADMPEVALHYMAGVVHGAIGVYDYNIADGNVLVLEIQ